MYFIYIYIVIYASNIDIKYIMNVLNNIYNLMNFIYIVEYCCSKYVV